MNDYSGRGYVLDEQPSGRSQIYRPILRIIYFSCLFQASLSFIFFALGVLFSMNSFHNHLIGFYALFFGVVSFCYNISYRPVKERVNLFFPKLEEDIVKFTFYFLVGIPGIGKSDSFQYQLGSILFTVIGFVGTLISLRSHNAVSTYLFSDYELYSQH